MKIDIYIYIYLFSISALLYNALYLYNRKTKCPNNYKILASGSSSNHFPSLLLMLYRIYVVESYICIVIWDLGISMHEKKELKKAEKYITQKGNSIIFFYFRFNYSNYPQHFDINISAGCYSWKPFIIYDTYKTFKRNVLWLDAGCYIKSKLDDEYNEINKYKIWSISGGTSIKRYTHINSLDILNADINIYNKTMCAGGVVGLYYPSHIVKDIMNLWTACALIKNCISPKGANAANHRQDQSILSILIYQHNLTCYNKTGINFEIHKDKLSRYYNDVNYKKYIWFIK